MCATTRERQASSSEDLTEGHWFGQGTTERQWETHPSTVLPGPQIKKAFFALVANGVRAAPLWDSKKQSFVGKEGLGRWRWWGQERRDLVRWFCVGFPHLGRDVTSRPFPLYCPMIPGHRWQVGEEERERKRLGK